MFVLVSMIPPAVDVDMIINRAKIMDQIHPNRDECVVGVFTTKELAVHGISSYTGTPHAGKKAVIYEMVPTGDKQKRVKIYEGSFPLCAPTLKPIIPESSNLTLTLVRDKKILQERIQKLEEKLESKYAECKLLKADNDEMTALITRMRNMIQV